MTAWLRAQLEREHRGLSLARLRARVTAPRLGWLLPAINVLIVLLVVGVLYASARDLLGALAGDNALARVQLAGAMAREEVRRAGEDTLTSARLLSERPTLQRLVAEGRDSAIEPFLERFCSTGGADACAVVQTGRVLAQAGAPLPWAALVAASAEQGERFYALPGADSPPVTGGAATLGGSTDAQAFVVRMLDAKLAQRLADSVGLSVRLVSFQSFDHAHSDELTQLHSMALADGQSAARRLAGVDAYVSSFPLFTSAGEAIVFIETRLPADAVVGSVGKFTAKLACSALVVALLALAAGVALARQVVRPLRALTDAAVGLGRGDLSTSIPKRGAAEVATLAHTMDDMRHSLVDLTDTLRRREAEAQAVLAGIVEGVYAVDAQRRITYSNPQAEKLLGGSGPLVGRFCGDVLRPCTRNSARPCETDCPIVAARTAGRAQATERLQLGGAAPRTVVVTSAAPVDGLQVQVLRDETELEAVRHARDSVLANISHEFRTPLGAQLASIELLRDGLDHMTAAQTRELVGSLERGVQRLTRLIDNLLESVRIESGQLGMRRQPLALADVLEDAQALLGSLFEQRRQALEIALPAHLPEFEGDGPRLTQVFVNLLANACKFGPEGSTVRVGADADARWLTAWVEDEGPGLPDLDGAIFERFHRAATQEPEPGGLGLGLWIVRSIVERQGGRVAAVRTAQQRTRFTVTLPIGAAP